MIYIVLEAFKRPGETLMKVADPGVFRVFGTLSLSSINMSTLFLLAIFYIKRWSMNEIHKFKQPFNTSSPSKLCIWQQILLDKQKHYIFCWSDHNVCKMSGDCLITTRLPVSTNTSSINIHLEWSGPWSPQPGR